MWDEDGLRCLLSPKCLSSPRQVNITFYLNTLLKNMQWGWPKSLKRLRCWSFATNKNSFLNSVSPCCAFFDNFFHRYFLSIRKYTLVIIYRTMLRWSLVPIKCKRLQSLLLKFVRVPYKQLQIHLLRVYFLVKIYLLHLVT